MLNSIIRSYPFTLSSIRMPPMMWGRWKREKENHLVYLKVDQANEDHCGCCIPLKEDIDRMVEIEQKELVYYCM